MKTIKNLSENIILKVENLSIAFGGIKAVDDVSFEIEKKQIFGLIGPNGAGKTTIFNMITQFYKPDNGEVYFRTKKDEVVNLVNFKIHEVISTGLVRTFQNLELVKDLSILDNILVGCHIEFKASVIQQAFRTRKAREEEKRVRDKAMKVLELLEIAEKANEYVSGQPYGILKKVELGRTLMSDPVLIILDEPAAGLNDSETISLTRVIKNIRDQYNCAIFLIEHDMGLVMDLCDRICVVSFGKKLAEGIPSEIQKNPIVQEAYLGSEV